MKTKLAVSIVFVGLFASAFSFAGCGGGGCGGSYYTNSGCTGCGPNTGICADCQCTDPGYRFNNCTSTDEYCEAFGNIGGR